MVTLQLPSRASLKPSWQMGFARSRGESVRPNEWDGLVGLWMPSLGPTGQTLYDLSGYGNHGTLNNISIDSGWVVEPEWGYAIDYLETDEHVQIPDVAILELDGGEFTMVASIEPDDYGQNTQGRVMDKGGGSGGADGWNLFIDDNQTFADNGNSTDTFMVAINNTEFYHGGDGVITLGAKHFLTVTLKGGALRFYVDGLQTNIVTSGVSTPVANSTVVRFGLRATDTNRDFDGRIGDCRLYERALSPNEVLDMYNDQWAIVRRVEDIIVGEEPAAVGGATIPVFDHRYRLLRTL